MADRFVRSVRLRGLFPDACCSHGNRHAYGDIHRRPTNGQTDADSETASRADASSVAPANRRDSAGRGIQVFAMADEPHAARQPRVSAGGRVKSASAFPVKLEKLQEKY